jgi:SAM-dependent methyltransferase
MICTAKIIRKIIKSIIPSQQYVKVSGSIIPSSGMRWCGTEFKDDNYFLASSESEANRLIKHFQCVSKSRILDVGCGPGRLPIGILRIIGEIDYIGIDVHRQSIDWCKHYISRNHPGLRFEHLNLYNERYNNAGIRIDDAFRFALQSKSCDIVYLFSVFSHTTESDMRVYLKEFLRILDDAGKVFFTTFVEENVPNVSVNPANYRLKCSGPLHVVRYNKDYLFSLLDDCGYFILDFTHATETDGQSAIYLSKKEVNYPSSNAR